MSLITDIRAVSENAIEQIAVRFSDLPRPLLAAIGAGDMAIERLADLRESLIDSIQARPAANKIDVGDVRSAVADLPAKAQKVAADVAGSIEQFAADAPARAQEMIAQFPDRLAEFQTVAQSLSPDEFRETLEAYTQLVGMIYGNLADRGDKKWSKVMAVGMRPGTVVDSLPSKPRSAGGAGPTSVAHTSSQGPARAARPRPATPRSATPRSATPRPATPTQATRRSAVKPATPGPAVKAATPRSAAKPATPRSAAKPATPKSVAKPATPKSVAKPATPKPAAKPASSKSATPEPIVISTVFES